MIGEGEKFVVKGLNDARQLLHKHHEYSFHMMQTGKLASKSGGYLDCTHIKKMKILRHLKNSSHGYDNLALDQFDRIYGVFETSEGKMRRIDIIVVPYIELAFALLGCQSLNPCTEKSS